MSSPAPDALLAALDGRRVLLTGPTSPDGDSIGACLALQRWLRARGVLCDVAGEASYRYAWMPGAAEMIADADLRGPYGAVVVLDGDRHRLEKRTQTLFEAADVKGIVDHHGSTTEDGYTHPWIAPSATSTCEMLYDAMVERGVAVDADLATLLYVGAIFDTGGFRYSNTTPATHRMAASLLETGIDHAAICARVLIERRVSGHRIAGEVFRTAELRLGGALLIGTVRWADKDRLGVVSGDTEGVVDALVHTLDVEVGALVIERQDRTVKVSLRSRGRVDVAKIAKSLSSAGGGHKKAAGASLELGASATRDRITELVADELEATATRSA